MTTFKQYLTESFKNLFTPSQKRAYADEAYAQLVSAYEKVGGIHGSGFNSPEDMVDNIPFWKLNIINGKLVAAAYYKDKYGRKRVAISSDGSATGKKAVADIMINDLAQGRAYVEQSSGSLKFLVKQLGVDAIKRFAIQPKQVSKLMQEELRTPPDDDPEIVQHPELKNFFYQRNIGGEWHTKIALGTAGKREQ